MTIDAAPMLGKSPRTSCARIAAGIAIPLLLAGLCVSAHGASETVLHPFSSGAGSLLGRIVQGPDGALYGTAYIAPDSIVYRVDLGGQYSVVATFQDQLAPLAVGNDGNLYGTTTVANGTIFRLTPAGAVTTLHQFSSVDGTSGDGPIVQGGDGNWYGAGLEHVNFNSTLYKFDPHSGAVTKLYTFSTSESVNLMRASDGSIYGAASEGQVLRISLSGDVQILHTFADESEGRSPRDLVEADDGAFYGITYTGGLNNAGTLYRMTPSGTVSVVYNFREPDAYYPDALIKGPNGNLYGTTVGGGVGSFSGSVFRFNVGSGMMARLHSFSVTDSDASFPGLDGLLQASDGNLYGVAWKFGSDFNGAIYKIAAPASGLLNISPINPHPYVRESNCETASVFDESNRPTANASITFTRSGANPGTATVIADASGVAKSCWIGSPIRPDIVTATHVAMSDTALVDWIGRPLRMDLKGYIEVAPVKGKVNIHPKATVTDARTSTPVTGRKVHFITFTGSTTLCDAITAVDGTAECKTTVLANAAELLDPKYRAIFAGDSVYASADATGPLYCIGVVCGSKTPPPPPR